MEFFHLQSSRTSTYCMPRRNKKKKKGIYSEWQITANLYQTKASLAEWTWRWNRSLWRTPSELVPLARTWTHAGDLPNIHQRLWYRRCAAARLRPGLTKTPLKSTVQKKKKNWCKLRSLKQSPPFSPIALLTSFSSFSAIFNRHSCLPTSQTPSCHQKLVRYFTFSLSKDKIKINSGENVSM